MKITRVSNDDQSSVLSPAAFFLMPYPSLAPSFSFLLLSCKNGLQAWRHGPEIPATQEAEDGGSHIWATERGKGEHERPVRLCLRIKEIQGAGLAQ